MGELIGIVLIIGTCYVLSNIDSWKFNNYMPPEGQTIDYLKMSEDLRIHNYDKNYVYRQTVQGKYNKKRDIY